MAKQLPATALVRLALGLFVLVALVALAGCGARQAPRQQEAYLRVTVVPEDASVSVNEHFFGRAKLLSLHPKRLSPGKHRISIEADGHFPHDMDIELPRGTTHLRVELRPEPL